MYNYATMFVSFLCLLLGESRILHYVLRNDVSIPAHLHILVKIYDINVKKLYEYMLEQLKKIKHVIYKTKCMYR